MLKIYEAFVNRLLVLLMSVLIIVTSIQVLGRYVPFIPHYLWTIELANFLLIWIVFWGSILGLAQGKHFFVDLFSAYATPLFETILKAIYYSVMLTVTFVFIFFGFKFFLSGCRQGSMVLDINLGLVYCVIPITGLSWLLFLLQDLHAAFFSREEKPI